MAEDNRTEAQKALGIHPNQAEDKEEGADPELDKEGTSEDEDDESEESSESPEEADKEDEDEDEPFKPEDEDESEESDEDDKDDSKKTVPLKRLLDEKKVVKELNDRISKLEAKFGEDASKELVAQMAKELKISPEAAQKLLEYSSKAVLISLEKEGKVVTPELKKKLQELEEGKEELTEAQQKQQAEKREVQYYTEEWNDFLPNLKKQYRNATPQMLKEAAQAMYKLARSKNYGNVPNQHPAYPLDYIFFKEKKAFDTLLRVSAKSASAPHGTHDVETEDMKIDFTDPNLTPQQYQRYKAQQNAKKIQEHKASGGIKFT